MAHQNSRKDWRNFEKRREDALVGFEQYSTSPPNRQSVQGHDNSGYESSNVPGSKLYRDNYGPSRNPSITSYPPQYPINSSVAAAASVGQGPQQQNPYLQQQQVGPTGFSVKNQTPAEEANPIVKNRKCRDVLCLGLFAAAIIVMVVCAGYGLAKGDLNRITEVTSTDGCDIPDRVGMDIASAGLDSLISIKKYQDYQIEPRDLSDDTQNYYKELAADFENSWQQIIWMCFIALGFAIIMTILLRLFAGVIIWVVVIGVSLASIAGSIVLWVIWSARKKDNDNEVDGAWSTNKVQGLMLSAIGASVFTVLLLLVFLFMRKRIALVIQLFNEAGKAVHAMPLLLLQPILTFVTLGISLALWFAILLLLETAGDPELRSDGGIDYCYYKKNWFIYYARWWNLFMMFWITQFVIGCQHLIIAGAVSTWFFARNKNRLSFPILTSFKRLTRYHLGTIAFGSLVVAIVKLIRYILNWITNRLGGTNPICKYICCCCKCFVWCLENFLVFLNRNAYIEVAIHGYGFCKSAKKAFKLIVDNALRMAAINSIGDFVLFLGKITIVAATLLIGNEILKSRGNINHIWAPLFVAGICAYFIAHCFISVYEMAIDTVFICFCEDCELNDGMAKPYFMSKGLMEFVRNSEKVLKDGKDRKNK